jgi:hypothetical protein
MPREAVELANEFTHHLNRLSSTRVKFESLFSSSRIKRHEIEQVYVGLYLDATVSFERFIETLFIGYLVGRIKTSSRRVVPRVSFHSEQVAREVVFSGQPYVDWFPYERTEKRAKAFFRNGGPFVDLQDADKKTIERFLAIRNAIAHRSRHSIRKFEKTVIGSLSLTGHERSPAGYLRSIFRISPAQTRYENLIVEMAGIAQKLAV